MENLGQGYAIWNQNGHLTSCNSSFSSLFGSDAENVIPKISRAALIRLLTPRIIGAHEKSYRKLFHAHKRASDTRQAEHEVQFIDGNWALISTRELAGGMSATTVTDVSRIKESENQAIGLAQRNSQLAVAISAMNSGVVIFNPNLPDSPVVFANPAFVPPPGVDKDDILGSSFASLFRHQPDGQSMSNCVAQLLNGETVTVNLHIDHPRDGENWFEVKLNAVFGETDQPNYYLGIQSNVTARKMAERDLESRMKQQAATAELGRQALAGVDLEELFNEAARLVSATLDLKYAGVSELRADERRVSVLASVGWRRGIIGEEEGKILKKSSLRKILSSAEPHEIRRTPAQAKKLKSAIGGVELRQTMGMRIIGRDRAFGILSVHSPQIRTFSRDDVNFIKTVAYILGVAVEQRQASDNLRESEHRFDLAVQGSNDGIWDWDLVADKMYFSSRWKSMLGVKDDEFSAGFQDWINRIHPEDQEEFDTALESHLHGDTPYFSCEHRVMHRDGSYHWMLARGMAVRDDKGNASRMAGSLSDITNTKRTESQLLKDALHDALTGLPNRALYTDRLTQAISRSSRNAEILFAVMFLDFDRFKMVNDSLGHSYGDQMLIEIGNRLSECVRDVDTVARLGGDEFAILLEGLENEEMAEEVARRINHALGQPFHLAGKEIVSNASIGIAFSSLGYSHPEEMIRDADIAMYQAKAEGRARHVVFEKGMHVRAVTQLETETDLRSAIENEEFVLAYQPVVDIKDQSIYGFEALIRWNHPSRGIVSPADFIPIAEETKLILPIGLWVLRQACLQINEWQAKFNNDRISISVNISPRQFSHPDLIEDVGKILAETGTPGSSLKFEITESAIMENPHVVTQKLETLRNMGIHLHVDDFGTGYSSLSHLHRFPIDVLKIDRSFVISMGDTEENMEIVRTIVALARNLKLGTVAEGVETKGDLELLSKLKCDHAQGYYFSKPMDKKAATAYLRKQLAKKK